MEKPDTALYWCKLLFDHLKECFRFESAESKIQSGKLNDLWGIEKLAALSLSYPPPDAAITVIVLPVELSNLEGRKSYTLVHQE